MWSDGEEGDGWWKNRRKWYETEDMFAVRQRRVGEQNAMEAADRADTRLRKSLQQVSAQKEALAQQVAKLTAAFDAFVELSDVRVALAGYTETSAVREIAKGVLAELVSPDLEAAGNPNLQLRLPNLIPGYWLPAAVHLLVSQLEGRGPNLEAEGAAACDPQCTAIFMCLALPIAGKAGRAGRWLTQALGQAPASDAEITAAVREVWRMAARSVYGERGAAYAADWLESLQGGADTVNQLHAALAAKSVSKGDGSEIGTQLARAKSAVASLEELGRWYASDTPPVADQTPPQASPTSMMLLDSLVAEGAPGERELIRRSRELVEEVRMYRGHAADIEDSAPRWDEPVGSVLALLKDDLLSAGANSSASATESAALQNLARKALRGSVAELANRLLAEACPEPRPTFKMRLDGLDVELNLDLPLDPQLHTLDEIVERRYAPEPGRVSRKQAAEAAELTTARKARNRTDAQTAIDQIAALRNEIPAQSQRARQEHTALLARLR